MKTKRLVFTRRLRPEYGISEIPQHRVMGWEGLKIKVENEWEEGSGWRITRE
jgi:hypothetical protein